METAARNARTSSGRVAGDADGRCPGAASSSAPAKKSKGKDDDLSASSTPPIFSAPTRTAQRAKLPPPPEEDSQLSVLLRPGLLADVEIFVEKIPNAISFPTRPCSKKTDASLCMCRRTGAFEQRFVKIARRSESVTVIAESLKAGEVVSLGDPFAKKDSGSNPGRTATRVSMPPAGGGTR